MAAASELDAEQWNVIKERVGEEAQKHGSEQIGDGRRYNWGTLLVLLFTTAAALLPAWDLGDFAPIPPALSGVAALLVGAERALGFGARWRYHRAMTAGYKSVLDEIDFLLAMKPNLTEDDQLKYAREALANLHALRRQESGIPGAGGVDEHAAT
jgi:hypothetical protein